MDKTPTPASLPEGADLQALTTRLVKGYEDLGVSHLLIAQRWWGDGRQIEASSLDCLAMTSLFAAVTQKMHLITAIHPGFFQPTAIAKWGSTIQQLTAGRWSINVTSGWNMQEFDMYGVDKLTHDARYQRAAEFIQVLRGAWQHSPFSYRGNYYQTDDLMLEPQPQFPLQIYQGGQSEAAIQMAANHADWMFLNGGDLERIEEIVGKVRQACVTTGRQVRFAMYAAPLCRDTDDSAWAEIEARLQRIDHGLLQQRQQRIQQGAQGMWADADALSALDTNEGYAARLIGSAETIMQRIRAYHDAGIEMLHLDLRDNLFNERVLPQLAAI